MPQSKLCMPCREVTGSVSRKHFPLLPYAGASPLESDVISWALLGQSKSQWNCLGAESLLYLVERQAQADTVLIGGQAKSHVVHSVLCAE